MTTTPPIVSRDSVAAVIDTIPGALPVAVAMTDLDGFGAYNERAGRVAADSVLAAYDAALATNLPVEATRHRVGGDEWVVVLPATSLEHALVLLDELRQHVDRRLGDDGAVTMSAGVAARPPHGENAAELLHAADEALHRSKREGRNRVAIYVEDKMVLKSNYYPRGALDRLARLSRAMNRTEASLLREALDSLLHAYAGHL